MTDKDTKYIECCCHDLDHLTRLCYEKEFDEFYFEIRILRFPGECPTTKINNKFDNIKHNLKKFKHYLINLWWAIKGRPSWYLAQPTYDREQAMDMAKFIQKKLKKNK